MLLLSSQLTFEGQANVIWRRGGEQEGNRRGTGGEAVKKINKISTETATDSLIVIFLFSFIFHSNIFHLHFIVKL